VFGFELLTRNNDGNRPTFGKVDIVNKPCERQCGNAEVQPGHLKPHAKPLLPTEKHNRSYDGGRNTDDAESEQQLNRQEDRSDKDVFYRPVCHTNMITVAMQ